MNSIQDASLIDRLNAGLKKSVSEPNKDLGQEQFFELMIAQLKNQDPTKPLDGQTQLAQIAQFSTVDGIRQLQQSFSQLAQSLSALQASSLVGRSVMIPSDKAYFLAGSSLQGKVTVTDNVKDLTVTLFDSSGREVGRLNLGDQAAGEAEFAWKGGGSNRGRQDPESRHRSAGRRAECVPRSER
jgi:flagellar basal-body rod modification protein FlgD